eukprot:gene3200-5928_t
MASQRKLIMPALPEETLIVGWYIWIGAAVCSGIINYFQPITYVLQFLIQEICANGYTVTKIVPAGNVKNVTVPMPLLIFNADFARKTYLVSALSQILPSTTPGTFIHDMFFVIAPAFVIGIIGLASIILNSRLVLLRWHKCIGAIFSFAVGCLFFCDGVADVTSNFHAATLPIRGALFFTGAVIFFSACAALLSKKAYRIAIAVAIVIILQLWSSNISYWVYLCVITHKEAFPMSSMAYFLWWAGLCIELLSMTAAQTLFEFQQQNSTEHVYAAVGHTITLLNLGCIVVLSFVLHQGTLFAQCAAPITIVSLLNLLQSFLNVRQMMSEVIAICELAWAKWASSFLFSSSSLIKLFLVDFWIFLFLMSFPIFFCFCGCKMVSRAHARAPRSFRAIWKIKERGFRNIKRLLILALRVIALAALEYSGTALLELWVGTIPGTFVNWTKAIGVFSLTSSAVSLYVTSCVRQLSEFRPMAVLFGLGAMGAHLAVRLLLQDRVTPYTPITVTSLLLATLVCMDISCGLKNIRQFYQLVKPLLTSLYHWLQRIWSMMLRVFQALRTAVIFCFKKLSLIGSTISGILQFVAAFGLIVLFIRPMVNRSIYSISDFAFVCSAWTMTCFTIVLGGHALQRQQLVDLGLDLFDHIDLGNPIFATSGAVFLIALAHYSIFLAGTVSSYRSV